MKSTAQLVQTTLTKEEIGKLVHQYDGCILVSFGFGKGIAVEVRVPITNLIGEGRQPDAVYSRGYLTQENFNELLTSAK